MTLDYDAMERRAKDVSTATAVEKSGDIFYWAGPLRATRDQAIDDGNAIHETRANCLALAARCRELELELNGCQERLAISKGQYETAQGRANVAEARVKELSESRAEIIEQRNQFHARVKKLEASPKLERWPEWKERAEKAEARVRELEQSEPERVRRALARVAVLREALEHYGNRYFWVNSEHGAAKAVADLGKSARKNLATTDTAAEKLLARLNAAEYALEAAESVLAEDGVIEHQLSCFVMGIAFVERVKAWRRVSEDK